jgi:ADP-ribose pyrophosphatase YjhB (NUDIX family)
MKDIVINRGGSSAGRSKKACKDLRHMKKIRKVRGLIYDKDNLCMVRITRGRKKVALAGGTVKPTEKPRCALRREAKEEGGWVVKVGKLIARVIEYDQAAGTITITLCYRAVVVAHCKPRPTQAERARGLKPQVLSRKAAVRELNRARRATKCGSEARDLRLVLAA